MSRIFYTKPSITEREVELAMGAVVRAGLSGSRTRGSVQRPLIC